MNNNNKKNSASYQLVKINYLQQSTVCVRPDSIPGGVTLDSPATDVFTDFKSSKPYVTTTDQSIKQIIAKMNDKKVHSLFVVDEEENVIGQVIIGECDDSKIAQVAVLHGVKPKQVTIEMLMIPFDLLPTLHYRYMENLCIGHIAHLFDTVRANYIIVTDDGPRGEVIRGLFSLSRLNRMLERHNITLNSSSNAIAAIEQQTVL